MNQYKVSYTRNLAGTDKRLLITDIPMTEAGLKEILLTRNSSRFGYLVLKAELIDPPEENLFKIGENK